ncbi:MAG: bifunctional phosphoribosyl-AMP cyclohydrolase/phosphoribosyl-ATP diphosphatase HisIE [Bacteroidota bacterium]|nr:bifunctional phosphoribosyl-AMP cyclohydrolase/phosphoribosyl-ATP diphosphatase HisIE [Bacteroidota bacterium]MDP4211927.1 bifunctional phosphoribosyl-AMP cyclohydrolase/phosphoribosyl-ATP diphosphatase HisIE [Bacteroidota bacterium]MDP4249268.1 bifunctional phosphoribosyl-AMP cyclohydrolase/phosphoribosyl-ATP diphosphatase HisIE [Bacteroidota bacterium]
MEVNFSKYTDGLVPAIVQDERTRKVLMLGFMNQAALDKTRELGKLTFYSRSKKRLWTKGEESGHFLALKNIAVDCDQDTLLIQATPQGPVCHTGADTCWGDKNEPAGFLSHLESVIRQRKNHPDENSYVSGLFKKGINKIAQKVGEEGVELIIEAKDHDDSLFLNEAADLLFHYLILLQAKGHNLQDVSDVLKGREVKR